MHFVRTADNILLKKNPFPGGIKKFLLQKPTDFLWHRKQRQCLFFVLLVCFICLFVVSYSLNEYNVDGIQQHFNEKQ